MKKLNIGVAVIKELLSFAIIIVFILLICIIISPVLTLLLQQIKYN